MLTLVFHCCLKVSDSPNIFLISIAAHCYIFLNKYLYINYKMKISTYALLVNVLNSRTKIIIYDTMYIIFWIALTFLKHMLYKWYSFISMPNIWCMGLAKTSIETRPSSRKKNSYFCLQYYCGYKFGYYFFYIRFRWFKKKNPKKWIWLKK